MAQVGTTFNVNQGALTALLSGPNGAVWVDIRNRGTAVRNLALRNISAGPMKAVKTGRLKTSIAMEMVLEKGAPTAIVGTNVEYALWVHDGTRRMPKRPFLEKALPAAFNP